MSRRSLAQILAENPYLAAMIKELNRVANQCREIVVDDTKPPKKKRAKKRARKPKPGDG